MWFEQVEEEAAGGGQDIHRSIQLSSMRLKLSHSSIWYPYLGMNIWFHYIPMIVCNRNYIWFTKQLISTKPAWP